MFDLACGSTHCTTDLTDSPRTLLSTSTPPIRINQSSRRAIVRSSPPSRTRSERSQTEDSLSHTWAVSDTTLTQSDVTNHFTAAVGTSPGRLVETDANFNIIHEWPEDVSSTLNILGEQFSPHGLTIDWEKKLILTSDFVVPVTILKPASALGIKKANTLRLWDLDTKKITSTITIPNGAGIQDVKFIPGNPESAALATAVGPGQVWIIYPFRNNPKGGKGVAELLFDLGPRARNNLAIYSDISDDGKLAYFTLTLGNHVAALDISDLDNVKRLDDPNEDQGILGPHYVKISPDKKNLLVTDYFVQTGDIGVVNTPADFKAQWIDILPDGSLSFNRSIDFPKQFTNRGGAKPHSAVIFDLTDPSNPKYY
jgi:selenium-binding protein 1